MPLLLNLLLLGLCLHGVASTADSVECTHPVTVSEMRLVESGRSWCVDIAGTEGEGAMYLQECRPAADNIIIRCADGTLRTQAAPSYCRNRETFEKLQ